MASQIGVGVSITLPYGRIGVSGGSKTEPDAPAYDLFWPGLGAMSGIDWPGESAPIEWPGL